MKKEIKIEEAKVEASDKLVSMSKSKKLPTIKIDGKEYTLIKDRILYFNERYPNGSIRTKLISKPSSNRIVIKATVIPDIKNPNRYFQSHASEVVGVGSWINKESALENASSSSVGRALAFMGIGIADSIASKEEIDKSVSVIPVGSSKKDDKLFINLLSDINSVRNKITLKVAIKHFNANKDKLTIEQQKYSYDLINQLKQKYNVNQKNIR